MAHGWRIAPIVATTLLAVSLLPYLQAQRGMVAMPDEIGISKRTKEPFTATEVTTLTQVPPSGATVTRTAEDKIARDSKGRWYEQQHLPWTTDPNHPVYYINIFDPIGHQRIHIDPQRNIAMRGPLQQIYAEGYDPYKDDLNIYPRNPQESFKAEKLGNQEIDGLKCWGVRTTHIIPAGMSHNRQEIKSVVEFWYSDRLGIEVVRKHSDPILGDQDSELKDLVQGDPRADMFSIPESYVVEPLPDNSRN